MRDSGLDQLRPSTQPYVGHEVVCPPQKVTLSDQEYQNLVNDFNAKTDASLLEGRLDRLFESATNKFPENIALIHNETEISYKQLNASANIIARGLAKRGLGYGDVVGLAVSRSIDLIAVILAVLKLGAAYVPIDPSFPAQRISHMVEDAKPKFILLNDELTKGLALWKDLCLGVSEARDGSIIDDSNLETEIRHQDLAYVIYTSGSTGRPKGVEVSHGAAANFLGSLRKHEPGCNERDRLLAITTISFDMSVLELFLPILSSSTMVIANAGAVRDPREIISLMQTHKVTVLQATPATWTMLLEAGWKGNPRLSKIICGGEPLSRQLADRLLDSADSVWNVYGPSETTYGSVGRVGNGDIVVGKPVVNGRIYVLDDNMSPVPVGCEGEVYIGGSSVSNGYRNKAELTCSRFLRNPFHGGLFFRTGDLARFIGYDKLQVTGRIDGVVKIRGHRIDVGDIEAVLVDHSDVSTAVVVSRDDRLVAYCVARVPFSHDAASLDSILRPWVAERLPSYMLPAFFVPMDALPLSPSEKVNRKALPDPLGVVRKKHTAIQPTSQLEQQIQAIWSELLGHDHFGIDDNFFNIGGDSVRIVRMQAALEKQLHRSVPTPKLFEHFTIKTLATYLVGSDGRQPVKQETPRRPRGPSSSTEDVAIISMACRLPGGVTTPNDFWQVLQRGGDTSSDIPKNRWDADKLYNADPGVEGTSYCRRGGFLDSINGSDPSFFGISPREARAMDPEQHLMLELCWEGFERAGYTKSQLNGSATGVFLGVSNNRATSTGAPPDLKGHSITGSADATLSGRLSYTYNLQGPSMTVDTACSSSLVATHLACNALRQGECDMALVGGVSLLLNPGIHIEFSRLRGLSADGRCRAFSDDTDGTGFSEGAATVVLKRLSDAQRDRDNIHAVLRGTAVMHGGHSVGLTAPNGPGQEKLIRTVLAQSALEPSSIDYIEAHGTATKLGDPIEATALAGVFGGRPGSESLKLGSAKSNVGHTQATAGLVGLLKVMLSLQNNTLPKTLHVREPTRAIDWKSTNMELVLENQPWLPRDGHRRRAGVSAFGIGGTIAHVIVEEVSGPTLETNGVKENTALPSPTMFLLSANNDSALRAQAGKLWSHIESKSGRNDRLADISYSLATSRTHFQRRLTVAANDRQQMLQQLDSISSGLTELPSLNGAGKACVGMLFTGQGSQRMGMGKDLYAVFPAFRQALDDVAGQFTLLEFPLLDVMWSEPGNSDASLLNRTDLAQPALFALEVSLWKLWQSLGVKASFLLGHSVGELAAAHVAGILNLPDACRLVLMRGRLMQAISRHGKTIAVETSSGKVSATIRELGLSDKVQVAGHNTPSQTVISGDFAAVEAVEAHFTSLGLKRKILNTRHAFHSHHMDDMLDDFRAVAQAVRFNPPTIPVISSMTGRLANDGELEEAEYWTMQARSAVRFHEAFQGLVNEGANIFVEIGPSPTLCGLGAACLAGTSQAHHALWLPSLKVKKDEGSMLQDSLVKLHVRNVSVDWSAFYRAFGCRRVELPTYAFQREEYRPAKPSNWDRSLQVADADQNVQDMPEMMFEINWRPVKSHKVQSTGSWGLLCPSAETEWTKDVQLSLSTTSVQLVPVTTLQEAEQLDGLVSLWDSEGDVIESAHLLIGTALAQLQEVIRTGYAAPVVWVTRHAISTGHGDQPVQIEAAPLWGLMRTARSEHSSLSFRLIDADDATSSSTLGLSLGLDDLTEIAVRKGQLLEPHMERSTLTATLSPSDQDPLLQAGGAVLVTGGLGDIGSRIAQRLVKSHGVRDLVLVSRRGMQSPGAEIIVAKLAKLGAQSTIIAGDVSVPEDVEYIMQTFTTERPLGGIIHAAGVVDSGTLSSLTPQKCASTFEPKVNGLWNLHQNTKDMHLDFFVMLSSISGVMGLPGLGNYAAANTFIDMLAHLRHAQGLPATSLAYGTWDGDGLTTTLVSTTRAHLSQVGLGLIAPEVGLDLLEQAVRNGRAHSIPAVLDVERLKSYYENQGGVPPFLRSMLGQGEVIEAVSKTVNLRDMLAGAAPEKHGGIVMRMVQETVAKALEYTNIEDLDVNRPLEDFGIDSLTAVLMRNRLTTLTGIALPPNITLLHPDLKSLSSHLLSQLSSEIEKMKLTATAASFVNLTTIRRGVLDPKIQFQNVTARPTASSEPPKTVLVTGPTGFVGAFMVSEFLRKGIEVYCLVRASNSSQAEERMVSTLQQYSLWKPEHQPLLHTIVGDLSEPLLGLSESAFDDLSHRIESILHSGALVDWMRPLEAYIRPNVLGTHEILRLASRGRRKAIHFISTISTLPIHLGYGLTESDGEYGYGTSKYLAERMVVAARFRGALASSYRLPFVAASATSGHFRLDRGDFLNNLISGSLDLGAFPSLVDANLSSVLPVDYLCQTIATIMTDNAQQRFGEDYDFINPRAPSFDTFFQLLGGGKPTVLFGEWHHRALAYAALHPKSSLARIATVLDGYTDETAGNLVKGGPVGRFVLGVDVFPAPEVDEGYVRRYLDCLEAARVEREG